MRTAHKVWSGIAAGVFCLVAIGDLSDGGTSTTTTAASPAAVSAPAPVAAPSTYVAPATVAPEPAGDPVTVTDVIDGETVVADGRRIRVLGIDACDVSTSGGRAAKQTAETFLEGQPVTLRTEPGIEKDKNGRLLRYVDASVGDYGTLAVGYDHTGVDAASPADATYLDDLRSADTDGRTCAAPQTSSSSSDDDDDVDLPLPRRGDNGLPDGALTGGYCAKKWWC